MRASLQPSWRSIFSGTWLDFTPESDLKSFFSPIHETNWMMRRAMSDFLLDSLVSESFPVPDSSVCGSVVGDSLSFERRSSSLGGDLRFASFE